MDKYPLKGLVTGGSRGLGLAIAIALLEAGAHVIITARPSDSFEQVAKQLQECFPNQIEAIAIDFTDIDAVQKFAEQYISELNFIVSNAALIAPMGALETTSAAAWEDIINVNMLAPIHIMRHAIMSMKSNNLGRIVFIAGGGITTPDPNFCAYATSKAGMLSFATSLAAEVSNFDITVNSVLPGPIDTSMNQQKIEAGPEIIGKAFYTAQQRIGQFDTQIIEPVQLVTQLVTAKNNKVSGKIISAQWDPWRDILRDPDHHLKDPTLYTVARKVSPKDDLCR